MLDNNMQAQLKAYLEKLTKPVELVANLDSSNKSNEIKQLLNQIAALSDKITVREVQDNTQRVPSFLITKDRKSVV